VLVVFAIVFVVTARSERRADEHSRDHATTVRPQASTRLEPRSSPD